MMKFIKCIESKERNDIFYDNIKGHLKSSHAKHQYWFNIKIHIGLACNCLRAPTIAVHEVKNAPKNVHHYCGVNPSTFYLLRNGSDHSIVYVLVKFL